MTTLSHGVHDKWISRPVPRPTAEIQLFCLPYAGGGASVFRAWSAAFGPRVEVVAVRLPGRETRMRERPAVEPAQVADAIAATADRPYAIFGHSMGGWLGFEVVRQLRRIGRPLPVRLCPSGINPPDRPSLGSFDGLSTLDDDEMTARLVAGGGVPAAVLAEPELFQLFLPTLRGDLTWVDEYEFVEEEPLPVPVVAFAGDSDRVATAERMPGWARHTTAGFTLHTLPGGHFFLTDQLPALASLIENDLLVEVS